MDVNRRKKGCDKLGGKVWTEEEKDVLKEMYKDKKSSEISGIVKRSTSAVYQKARQLGLKKNLEEISKSHRYRIPNSARKLTPEKAYVLGVVGPGDGSVSFERGVIELTVSDSDFLEEFSRCIEVVYGKPPKHRLKKINCGVYNGTYKQARLCSIEATRDILRYGKAKHFKHYHEKVPEEILNSPLEIINPYLRAFFDSQGTIGSHELEGSKANEQVLNQIQSLLRSIGIKSQVYAKKEGIYKIEITRFIGINKFKKLVGFTIQRKEKKLTRLLESYDYHHWTSEEEDFLRSNFLRMPMAKLEERLKRSESAIRGKAHRMGLKRNTHKKWNKKRVIAELQRVYEEIGKSPTTRDVDGALVYASERYFGSWNKAKKVAGLETAHKRWDKEKVKRELKRHAEELGKSPTKTEVPTSLVSACNSYFGSWNKAKKATNLPAYKPIGDSLTKSNNESDEK